MSIGSFHDNPLRHVCILVWALALVLIAMTAPASTFVLPDPVLQVLRPAEDLTVSEWADLYRRLNEKYCAEPGPWRTDRVPWIREIQDSFADPGVGSIIFVKGSRVSGTEAMNNMLAFSVDARPMPAMFVLPRKPDVEDELTGRIKSIYEDSPRLATHIPGGNWANTEEIHLDTMTVYGAAANTEGDLIRKTIGIAFFDEVDNCEASAGRLGDVWSLIEKRLTTFGYRAKIVGISTPSDENASAWRELQRSDFRKYHVPCPHCGKYQVLSFERLRVLDNHRDSDLIENQELVRYECDGCQRLLEDREKSWMVARGIWVPRTQQVEEVLDVHSPELVARATIGWKAEGWRPSLAGEPPVTRRRGYWMPSYYSTLGLTWSKIFAEFLRVKDDRLQYRVFVNQVKAEPWKEAVVVTDIDALRKKTIGAAPEGKVPVKAVKLLFSADVQLNHLYYVGRAFGPNEESWLITAGTCETFEAFYQIAFETDYPYVDGSGSLTGDRAAIDTRYRKDEVMEFCERQDPDVIPVMGFDLLPDKYAPKMTSFTPAGKRDPHSLLAYHLNTSYYKSKLHRLARQPEDSPGAWHLHEDTTEEYFRQFTAEELRWKRKKGATRAMQVWEPKREGMPNHYLDCEVYVLFLADHLKLKGLQPREVREARRQQRIQQAKKIGAKRLMTPDGRPFFVTQRS